MAIDREFSARFQSACRSAGLKTTHQALARFLGVSPITARNWWLGEKLPGMANAIMAANRLGVTVQWLLTGQGEQSADQADPQLDPHIVQEVLDLLDETGTRPPLTQTGNAELGRIIARTYPELARERRIEYRDRARSIVTSSLSSRNSD